MFFAKLHPLLVHFPVSGAVFELYGNFRGEKIISKAGSFNIRFGFWSSIPVATVGFLGLESIELKEEFKSFIDNHIFLTSLTILIFTVVILLSKFQDKIWIKLIYHVLLIAGLFAVLGAGFYGGELVHRFKLPFGIGG